MFPLAGTAIPTSSDDLAKAISDALHELLSFPPNVNVVTMAGGAYPSIGHVKIDLSGGRVVANPPPPPKPADKRREGISVDQLDVIARPIRYHDSHADLALDASGVRFDFAHDAQGRPMLVLAAARSGHVEVKIAKQDIQSLLMALATEAARPQKVTIQDLQVNLTSDGPRSIAVDVRVRAKKMMMSGVVTLRGNAAIDDNLVATILELSAQGEGVVGAMAAGFLQAKLKQFEGKQILLMAFSMGDVTLRDVTISTQDGLQLAAEFGNA